LLLSRIFVLLVPRRAAAMTETETEPEPNRMKKTFASLALAASLAVPAGALVTPAYASGRDAHGASLYPIPSQTPPSTPAAAAHVSAGDAASALSGLTPAGLAGEGTIAFDAAVSGPGTLKFVITAKIHGKTVVIGTGHETATAAGAIEVKIKLTGAGKAALKAHKGKLKVAVAVVFKAQHGGKKTANAEAVLR
jgi:hypothetical protein